MNVQAKPPPAVLDVAAWRKATPKELVAMLKDKRKPGEAKPAPRGRLKALVFRAKLKPVDVYAYLRARFGTPNGFQNLARKDDSDNWIHWDFSLKAGDEDVYIAGASREIHIFLSEALKPEEWRDLVRGLKADFARIGPAKSKMMGTFEKFVLFQNKYAALADICADLHATIVDAPAYKPLKIKIPRRRPKGDSIPVTEPGDRATELYAACTQLALLTPVMAEAFIHMLVLTLRNEAFRKDDEALRAFVREKVPDRIGRLHEVCMGMRPVDRTTPLYGRFMTVISKRNFALHGNVDPEGEAMETVYFEGKRPLYAETGHHISRFFEDLERLHHPGVVRADYEDVHGFLHELTTYLEPRFQTFLEGVIDDRFPGFEVRKRAVTRLFPDHLMIGQMQGMRYDDELKVDW